MSVAPSPSPVAIVVRDGWGKKRPQVEQFQRRIPRQKPVARQAWPSIPARLVRHQRRSTGLPEVGTMGKARWRTRTSAWPSGRSGQSVAIPRRCRRRSSTTSRHERSRRVAQDKQRGHMHVFGIVFSDAVAWSGSNTSTAVSSCSSRDGIHPRILHAFNDGRDTSPQFSVIGYLRHRSER